jgi:hypothetical protein
LKIDKIMLSRSLSNHKERMCKRSQRRRRLPRRPPLRSQKEMLFRRPLRRQPKWRLFRRLLRRPKRKRLNKLLRALKLPSRSSRCKPNLRPHKLKMPRKTLK